MGWSFGYKPKHVSASEFVIRNCLQWSTESSATYRVLDSGVVKLRTFYAAVEQIDKTTGERTVWATVILLTYQPKSTDNFGWKSMSENAGPVMAECPARILDLLTPTSNANAIDWRQRCRANIAARKSPVKLAMGSSIRYCGMEYVVAGELGRRGYLISGVTKAGTYRLSLSKVVSCEILPAPSSSPNQVPA